MKKKLESSRPSDATACSPSLKPQVIHEDAWYYEYKTHLEVVHWVTNPDQTRSCHTICIPWRKIKKSAARCLANV